MYNRIISELFVRRYHVTRVIRALKVLRPNIIYFYLTHIIHGLSNKISNNVSLYMCNFTSRSRKTRTERVFRI